ncbi:MAG: hypothetical protein F6J93_07915 [Oscillatoria sp. SIO1A7]|nr:hypothetical protein [Oscillatoria sp. SIO1A7]
MLQIKQLIQSKLEKLNEEQLGQVADYIDFLQFRALWVSLRERESNLAALYSEFDGEDLALAEQGIEEYAEMLRRED